MLSTISALVIVIRLLASVNAVAQPLHRGPRSGALADPVATPSEPIFGAANPASYGPIRRIRAATIATRSFGLRELDLGNLAVVLPVARIASRLSISSFGFELFRTVTLGLTVARPILSSPRRAHSVGVRIDLTRIAISGYGSTTSTHATLGWAFRAGSGVHLGLVAANVVSIGPFLAGRAPALLVGAAYQAASSLVVHFDTRIEPTHRPETSLAANWSPLPAIELQASTATEPTRTAAGFSVYVGSVVGAVASLWHRELGWSHVIGVAVVPK